VINDNSKIPEKNSEKEDVEKEDIEISNLENINNNILEDLSKKEIDINTVNNNISKEVNISNVNDRTYNNSLTFGVEKKRIKTMDNIINCSEVNIVSDDSVKKIGKENNIENQDSLNKIKKKKVRNSINGEEGMGIKNGDNNNYNYNLGEHNFIFINISKDNLGKLGTSTPKLLSKLEKEKSNKLVFSQFYKNIMYEKSSKNQTNNINPIIIKENTNTNSLDYTENYSEAMIKEINCLRKYPQIFLEYIDNLSNNAIEKNNEEIYLISNNKEEKIIINEDYLLVFDQIKRILKEIIDSQQFQELELFIYNGELEIQLNNPKNFLYTEKSSRSNEKFNSHRIKKKVSNLDFTDDRIANLILEKRKEIKKKYPNNVFKMNVIQDIKLNILIIISMELLENKYGGKQMLKDIIFNPEYKNFAVSWTNEINRKFISISCFA
jgi:hypothetical protein